MKIVKKLSILVFAVTILYLSISVGFRVYVEGNSTIKFLNEEYSLFDASLGNFVPFGADNSWYQTNIDYDNLFGLSFLETDKDKNVIYYKTILGTTVYIKDTYKLPNFPKSDVVDELIIYCEAEDKTITITNHEHIHNIVNFLSSYETSANKQSKDTIVFYAVSNKLGGVYQLNESGSIYINDDKIRYGDIVTGELPENVQEIIKTYL